MMIWNRSDKITTAELNKFDDFLSQYDTDHYEIRLGKLYDPDDGNVLDIAVYHIINRNTGVIEYQGSTLPAVIQHCRYMNEAMDAMDQSKASLIEFPKLIN